MGRRSSPSGCCIINRANKMSNITTLIEAYGKAMTPKEVAIFLGVDYRTVIKYADRWGGVEVSPGKYKFYKEKNRCQVQ